MKKKLPEDPLCEIYRQKDCSKITFKFYQSDDLWFLMPYLEDGTWTEDKIGFHLKVDAIDFVVSVDGLLGGE